MLNAIFSFFFLVFFILFVGVVIVSVVEKIFIIGDEADNFKREKSRLASDLIDEYNLQLSRLQFKIQSAERACVSPDLISSMQSAYQASQATFRNEVAKLKSSNKRKVVKSSAAQIEKNIKRLENYLKKLEPHVPTEKWIFDC